MSEIQRVLGMKYTIPILQYLSERPGGERLKEVHDNVVGTKSDSTARNTLKELMRLKWVEQTTFGSPYLITKEGEKALEYAMEGKEVVRPQKVAVRIGVDWMGTIGSIFINNTLFMMYSWPTKTDERHMFTQDIPGRLKAKFGGEWKVVGQASLGELDADVDVVKEFILDTYLRYDRREGRNDYPHNPCCEVMEEE